MQLIKITPALLDLENSDLTVVKSAKQFKILKSEVCKWEQLVTLSNICLFVIGLFFFIVSLLELSLHAIPLTVFISMLR